MLRNKRGGDAFNIIKTTYSRVFPFPGIANQIGMYLDMVAKTNQCASVHENINTAY
jgi:hypothetical protein